MWPPLGAEDLHVWAFDTDVGVSRLAELGALLSHDEQERAWRFRLAVDRARFIARRGQLRLIIGRYAGITPQSLRFTNSPYGKPSLSMRTGVERLRFNASGSEGIALVGVRLDVDVGVDIERVRPLPDAPALAARCLTASESAELAALPEAEFLNRFFEYWTRKEAIVKSLGRGVSLSFDQIDLQPWPGEAACAVKLTQDKTTATQWVIPLPAPRHGYVAALATVPGRRFADLQIRSFALPAI